MSLFGKKKEEKKVVSECACNKNAVEKENINTKTECGCKSAATENICSGEKKCIRCIKVLGSGCKYCHELYENAQEAVKTMGLNIEIEYVTDIEKVVSYGVMSTPALVVNEKVVSMGKVLKAADIEKLLYKLE